MSKVRIKICGITSAAQASAAWTAGADAIGLMFYAPSPRHLEFHEARVIRQSLPPFITVVAVMVNPDADYVTAIIETVGVDRLQFHGEESDEFCKSFGLPYIKGVRVSRGIDLNKIEVQYPGCSAILLDTHIPDLYGGSGRSFDWQLANYGGNKPVILAGGLTSKNIPQALSVVTPYGVDVSTGVETDGVKDTLKIVEFCQNVQNFQ